VSNDQFAFDQFDELEARLRRVAHDAAYAVVWDRTDREVDEKLGRFDFAPANVQINLADDVLDSGLREDAELPPGAQSEALCRWLRGVALSNMEGADLRRFRVRVYGSKGSAILETGSYACRRVKAPFEFPVIPALRDPDGKPLTYTQASERGAARGMEALAIYYAQWGQLLLGSVAQMQGINNQMHTQLYDQLRGARGQVDQLLASVLESRANEIELAQDHQLAQTADGARTALLKEAMDQLGQAARVMVAGKGVSPELTEVLGAISGSPELMATLTDPEVRKLMREPANLQGLAQMLKAAAAQQAEAD